MPQNASFSHRISHRLPESATKVVFSVLWVSSARGTTVHRLFKVLHACTLVFFGAFLAKFPLFCIFLAQNRHFNHNQGPKYCLSRLVPAFSSLVAAVYKTFRKLFLVSLSTSARDQEKHQKTPKMRIFLSSAIFFCRKTLHRVSLHL